MLKSFLYNSILISLFQFNINCQTTGLNNNTMETIFYRDNLESPVSLKITPVKIKEQRSKTSFKDYTYQEEQKNYLTRYLNPEHNSRLDSELPKSDLWEVKWKAELNSSTISWSLLVKNERIIIQNESGWQIFDTNGKNIADGIKYDGDIMVDPDKPVFYINDPSGFIAVVDIESGKNNFLFYPYLGKGFRRSVIYSSGNKIISCGFELPVMTHNSPIKTPELTIFELTDLGASQKPIEDGILDSAVQVQNLLCNTQAIVTAICDSTIVLAAQNHIYLINNNLEVIKDLSGEFIPLEISLDEEMRIYLLAQIEIEDKFSSEFWIIDPEGNLICRTKIPPVELNYLTPPAIDFTHTAYIAYKDKIIAVSSSGDILWEQYVQQPLGGISAIKDNLFVSEGDILTAFDHKGERKYFYNFDDELSTAPIMVNNRIFVATRKHLYCLTPK